MASLTLLSLLDMIELLSAEDFYQIITDLPRRRENLRAYGTSGTIVNGQWIGPQIRPADLTALQGYLDRTQRMCVLLSLEASLRDAVRLQAYIASGGTDAAHMQILFSYLQVNLIPDIHRHQFGPIPSHKLSYCRSANELFGDKTIIAFPALTLEIEDAGVCFAMGLTTACVCHLMRMLEVGLHGVAHQLNIPYDRAQWEQIVNKIPEKADEFENLNPRPQDWRDWRDFYKRVYLHFDCMKDSYRNYAMHAKTRYNETEAESIFKKVRDLMAEVSIRVKQAPG